MQLKLFGYFIPQIIFKILSDEGLFQKCKSNCMHVFAVLWANCTCFCIFEMIIFLFCFYFYFMIEALIPNNFYFMFIALRLSFIVFGKQSCLDIFFFLISVYGLLVHDDDEMSCVAREQWVCNCMMTM